MRKSRGTGQHGGSFPGFCVFIALTNSAQSLIMTVKGRDIMAKSATLNIRTDPMVKAQAEAIYQRFGITLTDAVNIFLRKSIMDGGLPFDMRQPNAETFSAIMEAEDIIAGRVKAKEYASARALFDELDAEGDDA